MTRSREILEKYGGGKYGHMFELDRLYPEVAMFGDQCISAEIGPGWVGVLTPVLEVLKKHGCKVSQIKQKFCELVVYWDYPDHIEEARGIWRAQVKELPYDGPGSERPPFPLEDESDAIDVEVGPVVARAAALSLRTCEECGTDLGENRGPKSGRNECDPCREKAHAAIKAKMRCP